MKNNGELISWTATNLNFVWNIHLNCAVSFANTFEWKKMVNSQIFASSSKLGIISKSDLCL